MTPSVSSKGASDASDARNGLAEPSSSVCTAEGNPEQADPVAALLALAPADRARLAEVLVGKQAGQGDRSREGADDGTPWQMKRGCRLWKTN